MDLYGIANCATVKKARVWLDEQHIAYTFHDFKKTPPTPEWIAGCLQQVGLDVLLNKRGTTWRKLTPEQQAQAQSTEGAIALMCEYPSVIKRPVCLHQSRVYVGFSPEQYQQMVQAA
ncbi:ArsC family reductase [Kingella kingae]|uniref:ArsC family reductase n=1 Tax=Kingella kingae TaxID=504 RepID=UPI00040ACFA5|nr:ArsC family reductase [Kingella kingae]MDK4536675.1 ArsC family reductase [Kingella kingae]MDK4538884.1 ArsC family reductase [Kingella kingae]MDK4547142.1 ArsC family reductase [Kingella kingae]MDK4622991.1 ArsC family reductase [Kingella kingae]